jgi:hypothetical protein
MALASRLAQLQAKACEATRFVARHGCEYQRSLVEKNKKYVVEPPTIEKCQELSNQLFYTRLARFVQSVSSLPHLRIMWQIVCAVLPYSVISMQYFFYRRAFQILDFECCVGL